MGINWPICQVSDFFLEYRAFSFVLYAYAYTILLGVRRAVFPTECHNGRDCGAVEGSEIMDTGRDSGMVPQTGYNFQRSYYTGRD